MYLSMMHLAEKISQLRIVILARRVMLLDTQDTGWNCDSEVPPLLLSHLAPCCADWPLISHRLPLLNAR